MSAEVAPSTTTATARRPLGYGLVALTGLLLGAVGIVPGLILGYAFVQWVLAPLGLAAADASNDDGAGVLVVAGVVVPALLIAAWSVVVSISIRRFLLPRRPAWLLAVATLLLPTLAFVAVHTV